MKRFLILGAVLFVHGAVLSALVRLSWGGSAGADGYLLHAVNWPRANDGAWYDCETNTTATLDLPGDGWEVFAFAYSTNNADGVRVLSAPSNVARFVVPSSAGVLSVRVDRSYVPPVLALSSNAQARATVFLSVSTNAVNWSAPVPVFSADVGDGPAAQYRVSAAIERLP